MQFSTIESGLYFFSGRCVYCRVPKKLATNKRNFLHDYRKIQANTSLATAKTFAANSSQFHEAHYTAMGNLIRPLVVPEFSGTLVSSDGKSLYFRS